MTDGLKGLAGFPLRAVLGKAAATPLSGAFWSPAPVFWPFHGG